MLPSFDPLYSKIKSILNVSLTVTLSPFHVCFFLFLIIRDKKHNSLHDPMINHFVRGHLNTNVVCCACINGRINPCMV